jgi:cytochrome c-type biogenesis protein CcmH/NrfG
MTRRFSTLAGVVLLLISLSFAIPALTARELLTIGRVDEAIASLRTRLNANPNDAEAYHLLSRAYFSVQRWDDAISNGERATSMQPGNSDYHLWLGRAYGEKADSSNFVSAIELAKKARAQFEQAVQLNGSNLAARADLAEFYVSAPGFLGGGKDKARAQADLMSSADPAASHWIRAVIADKDKNYELAEHEFKAAVQTSRTPAKRWLDLASFYRRNNRLVEMEDAINKALKVPNREPYILYASAEILNRAGRDFTGAIQLLRTYLNSGDPNEEAPLFEAHYLLGSLLEKTGDRAGAAQEYRTTLSLAKDFRKAQAALKRVQ